jgi:transposase
MIDYQTFQQIRLLHDQKKLKVSQIALELNLDTKTVEKWVDQPRYQPRQSPKRESKLDSFKGQIVALLERHPYTGQQIFQRIREQGFAGGYTILKEFVRQIRPVRKPAFLELEFAAGECAQADWGQFGSVQVGSTRRRLSFFVMVLCYSRLMYLEFTLAQTMEQFLTCHRHALEFFHGSPSRVMIDNLKVGVVRHPLGQPALFNPRYLDFAAHYGFEPVACNRGKGNEKGRVENGVGYVKKNFLAGLEILSFEPINPAGRNWLDETANVRLHRETHHKPIELFEQEKALLRPLPVMPYDCAVIRPVSANRCCRISFDGNRYSVPHLYASQKLTLKIYPDLVHLFHNEKLIATHTRSYDRRQKITEPDHHKELVNQRKRARDQTLLLAFLNLTPQAEAFCRGLQDKRLNVAHHIQKIVALSEVYSPDKVARAIEDALHFEAFGCEYVANILQQRERVPLTPSALHLTHHQDLLDLELPAPDMDVYERRQDTNPKPLTLLP